MTATGGWKRLSFARVKPQATRAVIRSLFFVVLLSRRAVTRQRFSVG